MRGYGQSDAPDDIDRYTLFHLVGDMVGLLDALGAESAVIAGHDWGAPVAWHAALLRPDRFRAVIGLSVPFRPRGPARPTTVMPQTDDAVFYQLYFQTPGVAEAELERDVRTTIRRLLYSASGDAPRGQATLSGPDAVGMVPRRGGFLSRTADPSSLPSWLTNADIDRFVDEFARTGFRGGARRSARDPLLSGANLRARRHAARAATPVMVPGPAPDDHPGFPRLMVIHSSRHSTHRRTP